MYAHKVTRSGSTVYPAESTQVYVLRSSACHPYACAGVDHTRRSLARSRMISGPMF